MLLVVDKVFLPTQVELTTSRLLAGSSENDPVFYGIRVVSYGLILLAIWQKNR